MQDVDVERGVWAVVTDAAGKKYVGRMVGSEFTEDDVLKCMVDRCPVKMEQVFALIEMDLPMQTPQGGAIQHISHLRPMDNCEGPSAFHIMPSAVHFFTDMSESDRRRHKGLVEQIAHVAVATRAERAGIQLVGPGGMPRGPSRPT